MTFIELLMLLSITTPFGCSMVSGWKADRWHGLLMGLVIGAVLSIVCFYGVRLIRRVIWHHPKLRAPHPGAIWIVASWLLVYALMAWLFGFAILGMFSTEFVIHRFGI